MKLVFASLAFGYSVKKGGNTPNWATSLGQGKEHKININSSNDELLRGMIYSSVSPKSISTKIGKGGKFRFGDEKDTPIVIGSVFSNVYVNNVHIENAKFILIIIRDSSEHHKGRLILKYSPSNTYTHDGKEYSNIDFYRSVEKKLNLANNACWFISNIDIQDQNKVVLKAIIVNHDGPVEYEDKDDLHSSWEALEPTIFDEKEGSKFFNNTGYSNNRVIYGAPGTGKSFKLNKDRKNLLYNDENVDEDKLDISQYGWHERVTFHPDYSYASFVGTYKPVPCKDENNEEFITYEYVPGPFMRVLTSALKSAMIDKPKPYLLIIEEINRANVAAVFGDVFQLLDRDNDGVSEYSIQTSNDMRDYLAKELDLDPSKCTNIKIPNNMFIWATMNSADQGVFPMDTAFKRRWNFEYLDINDGEDKIKGKTVTLGQGDDERKVEWNDLRVAINDFLVDECRVNEDKLLGPFFIYNGIIKEDEDIDNQAFINIFKNKVLMYLFEDAAKQKRETLFEGVSKYNLLSSIMKEFDTKGINIFNKKISNKFTKQTGDDQ